MDEAMIRIAHGVDVPAVAVLFDMYRQFYHQPTNLPLATQFLKDRVVGKESIILLAESYDRELIGFCQLYPTFCSIIAKPIFVLYDLYVVPKSRNNGVAKLLITHAYALATERGVARIDLSTAKDNFTAQALYESCGWERDFNFYVYSRDISC